MHLYRSGYRVLGNEDWSDSIEEGVVSDHEGICCSLLAKTGALMTASQSARTKWISAKEGSIIFFLIKICCLNVVYFSSLFRYFQFFFFLFFFFICFCKVGVNDHEFVA